MDCLIRPLVIAMVVAPALCAGASIELLKRGEFRCQDIPAKTGEEWLCIYEGEDDSTFHVATCTTLVREVGSPHPCVAQVLEAVNAAPIFFIRGAHFVEVGEVQGVIETAQLQDKPGNTSSFRRSGQVSLALPDQGAYELALRRPRSEEGPCHLVLRQGQNEQVLESADECGGFTPDGYGLVHINHAYVIDLVWAGDLDHDGRLDLVIGAFSMWQAGTLTLYLSSSARSTEFVGRAAVFSSFNEMFVSVPRPTAKPTAETRSE